MYAGKKELQGLPDDDPKWIKEIFHFTKKGKLTDKDKKLIRELYLEYKRDGLTSRDALEKAKTIVLCFEK
jgi:hypothetical protein